MGSNSFFAMGLYRKKDPQGSEIFCGLKKRVKAAAIRAETFMKKFRSAEKTVYAKICLILKFPHFIAQYTEK
jgi:hypothetical protein